MDNIGNYITLGELLDKLYPSTYVSHRGKIQLFNKAGNQFEYTAGNCVPTAGDIVCQGEYFATVVSVGALPATIVLDDATDIAEGVSKIFRSILDADYMTAKIVAYMQVIDTHTGQWFNKRDLTVNIEGANSTMLHFSVPIIEVASIKINESTDILSTDLYRVFSSRTLPDDRRNPKIKLLNDHFFRDKLATIEGSWGWLEPDGSTPELIKQAVARLVMLDISRDPMTTGKGQIRAEKTDMHEIHYAFTDVALITEISSLKTGDADVDRIIQLYKAPFSIGGTSVDYIKVRSPNIFEELYG